MTRREFWEERLGSAKRFGSADVARICGVTQRTVQRWIEAGDLLALASGTEGGVFHARISRDAFLHFLLTRTRESRYPKQGQFELFY